jgi:cation:H+ antiporter
VHIALFEEWGLLGNTLVLLASLIVLDKASDWTITNSVKVAEITGFGKTTVGFILVAFATSLPELSVAIFAAIQQQSIGVAIGNVLGSNIVNICLILGICFLLLTLKTRKYVHVYPSMKREEIGSLYFGIFVASIIPLILLYIGFAHQYMGIILLTIFFVYLYQLSKTRTTKEEGTLGNDKQRLHRYSLLTLLGAVGVVIASFFIVDSASFIAQGIGIPRIVIGATIVAFGTSLPELATSIGSVRKGHLDLALGNIVGSCFINITCILGVVLIASPLRIDMAAFSSLAMFSLITNLFLWYFLSNERISWREGAVLLIMYAIFLATSFSSYKF